MRAAGRVLNEICAGAADFIRAGRKEYEVIADIDRLARDKGAEDIRILAGSARLNPPSFKQAASIDGHWAVYLAVQHERYWAEAGRTFIFSGDAKLQNAYGKSKKSLLKWWHRSNPVARLRRSMKPRAKHWVESYARLRLRARQRHRPQSVGGPFFTEGDAHQVGAASVGATSFSENMTVALR